MAAVGDIVSGYDNDRAADGTFDIKPAGTVEWVIHNIYFEDAGEVYWNDGTHSFIIATVAAGGGILNGLFSHVNATNYLTLKNKNAGAKDMGYDGVITRM
jgi:DNA-binding beta-propeller fold protein YncE